MNPVEALDTFLSYRKPQPAYSDTLLTVSTMSR